MHGCCGGGGSGRERGRFDIGGLGSLGNPGGEWFGFPLAEHRRQLSGGRTLKENGCFCFCVCLELELGLHVTIIIMEQAKTGCVEIETVCSDVSLLFRDRGEILVQV